MHQGYRYMHLPYYKRDATYIKAMVSLTFCGLLDQLTSGFTNGATCRLPLCCESRYPPECGVILRSPSTG